MSSYSSVRKCLERAGVWINKPHSNKHKPVESQEEEQHISCADTLLYSSVIPLVIWLPPCPLAPTSQRDSSPENDIIYSLLCCSESVTFFLLGNTKEAQSQCFQYNEKHHIHFLELKDNLVCVADKNIFALNLLRCSSNFPYLNIFRHSIQTSITPNNFSNVKVKDV